MIKTDKIELNRSEQIKDIVGRMPVNGVKWVLLIVLLLVLSMIIFGYVVKYPEIVSGPITITTNKAPVILVAKNTGRLRLLGNTTRMSVKAGEVFALFQNTTNLKDLLHVDSLLQNLSEITYPDSAISFSLNLNLGELNAEYYQFVSHYEKLLLHRSNNLYDEKIKALTISQNDCDTTIKYSEKRLLLKEKQLQFYRREVSRDSMRLKIGDYIEREYEQTKNVYYAALDDFQSLEGSISSNILRKKSLINQRHQLRIEQSQGEAEMRTEYMHAYRRLSSAIENWKEYYAFVAPIDGIIEFLDFWRDNNYIAAGKEVFTIIPKGGNIVGHMLLPSIGSGKVKKDQVVTIQLDDYPHLEFGSINGTVESISLITNKQPIQNGRNNIDNYLLTIQLPNGLTTKFGSKLAFKYEIKGVADIQTKKRRLIQRLFDNLKYISQK